MRLPVVLLWHMHQPQYRDALSGEYILPWTYLHAIKDYSDMAAHLEQNLRARAVVNFTPVLIEQLEEYSRTISRHLRAGVPLPDRVLAMLGDAPLPRGVEQRRQLMQACLRAHRKHMVDRFEAFAALAELAEQFSEPQRAAYLSDAFLHDLGVWYHLAWLGEATRREDARVRALIDQGRGYNAAQRRELLKLIAEIIVSIVPRYRALALDGRVELSVSPYSHPILPLLFDFRAARESQPGAALPRHDGYPGGAQRASWHMAEAVRRFTDTFGSAPQGCWPSEGAVSDATLALAERHGFRWIASSANVLRASLAASGEPAPEKSLDQAYSVAGQRLRCVFRHDALADEIGFRYATWHGDDAAADLCHRLAGLARDYAGDPARFVVVALDGENAWEHYPFNGFYFLRALYDSLANHPDLELTTLSDVIARDPPAARLQHVVAGSWVHGSLSTWMGEPSKNAAWDLLCEAKQVFDRVIAAGTLSPVEIDAAEGQLALCESSDWFWWFGDYNPADAVRSFDDLYRHQLRNLYRLLRAAPPAALEVPLCVGGGSAEHGGVMRRADAQ